jgi:putative ABC transport system permease protein
VRLLLRVCLGAKDREFLIGDLEEEWRERTISIGTAGARTSRSSARRWLWRQTIGLIWTHGRRPLPRTPAGTLSREGSTMALSISTTDARYAVRAVASSPALTLSLVATLGGGIALATIMFSVLNAVLLVPLPYTEPGRLVSVWEEHASRREPRSDLSPGNFLDLRDRNNTFDSLAAIGDGSANLTGAGDAERLSGQTVTWNYFQMLGVGPVLGRGFGPDDERLEGARTAIISARLWARRFNSDPAIVGRAVRLDDHPTTIVGVMSTEFVSPGADADVWLPMRFDALTRGNRTGHFLSALGRLKPGVTREAARADLDRILIGLTRELPGAETNLRAEVLSLREQLSGTYRPTVLLLLGAVSFVLLMACANAANLLLARASVRRREMAIRMALGADRKRLRGQVLTESLIVAGAAGMAGLLISVWGVSIVNRLLPASLTMFGGNAEFTLTGDAMTVAIDWRVLAFAVLATLATGLLFGVVPAHQASDVAAHDVLRESRTTGGIRARTRKLLVVAQLAIAVVLLVAAGLLLRSVARLHAVDPGFDAGNVVTMRTVLSPQAYPTPRDRQRFYDAVIERVRALPGVESAGFITFLPLTFDGLGGGVAVESRPIPGKDYPVSARYRMVTHDYLRALRVPLRHGRMFNASDTSTSTPVAVVSDAFARALWPDDPTRALGQRVKCFGWPKSPDDWLTIVGITGAVRQTRLDAEPPLEVYTLQSQRSPFAFAEPRDLAIRVAAPSSGTSAASDPLALAPRIRAIIRDIDPEQPVTDVRLLTDIVQQGSADRRVYLWLLGAFAALTLGLGAFGLASVMSYVIAARRRELSLRLALGARPRQVIAMVAGECARLVAAGMAVGLGAALVATRTMRSWLYETAPADPLTLAIVPIVFAACCFASCAVPLWRATKADPVAALRAD